MAPDRGQRDVYASDRGVRDRAAGARDGLARSVAADPQPGDDRGEPRSSSPAGDALPPLYASGAEVEVESVRGSRRVPVEEFVVGPKRNTLAEDELIAAVWMPVAGGPQQFAKVGTRNAMVIAVCSFALASRTSGWGRASGPRGRPRSAHGTRRRSPVSSTRARTFRGAAERVRRARRAAASPIDESAARPRTGDTR